ncbi:MAG: hypothetical protein WBD27_03200 [Pyrinomonadaceae bacterium]
MRSAALTSTAKDDDEPIRIHIRAPRWQFDDLERFDAENAGDVEHNWAHEQEETPEMEKLDPENCQVIVYQSGVGSLGSASGSSGSADGHLFITTTYQVPSEGITSTYAYRAGPQSQNPVNFGSLEAIQGPYNSTFADFPKKDESSPNIVYNKNFAGSCENFDASFQKTTDWTNFSKIKYGLITPNSNSFVYTALTRAGLDIKSMTNIKVAGWGYVLKFDANKEPRFQYPRYRQ